MTKQEKINNVSKLANNLKAPCYYIIDAYGLKVSEVNIFRKKCHEKNINYKVVKNTLLKKAIEEANPNDVDKYQQLIKIALKGFSGLMIIDQICNIPAKVLNNFRKETENEYPKFKGAIVDGDIYLGEQSLQVLTNIKSKNELIGDVISLLKSPASNAISALQSPGYKLAGILNTLIKKKS